MRKARSYEEGKEVESWTQPTGVASESKHAYPTEYSPVLLKLYPYSSSTAY